MQHGFLMSYEGDLAWIFLFDNCKWKPVLKFDLHSNQVQGGLKRLYCINNWKLHCIDAYSWNRLAVSQDKQIYF